jgi:hypothetical protein
MNDLFSSPPAPVNDSTEEFLATLDFDEDFDLNECVEEQVVLCQPVGQTSVAELSPLEKGELLLAEYMKTNPSAPKVYKRPSATPHFNPNLSPDEIASAKAEAVRQIKALISSVPGNHSLLEGQMEKVIGLMEYDEIIYMFSGKCGVPARRAKGRELSLADPFSVSENGDNHSVQSFAAMVKGLPATNIFAFNMRDTCRKKSKKYGTCAEVTQEEADLVASVLNIVGNNALYIGCKLILCNTGGSDLYKLYNRLENSLFEMVLSGGTHMSNCVRFRSCFNSGKDQMIAVYAYLSAFFEMLGLNNNHKEMIKNGEFKMVVDLDEIDGHEFAHFGCKRKPKQPKQCKYDGCTTGAVKGGFCEAHVSLNLLFIQRFVSHSHHLLYHFRLN